MKILVIGNGFDLDHNLPTSYKNFLNFCEYIIFNNIEQTTDNKKTLSKQQYLFYKRISKDKTILIFINLLVGNKLIKYFINKSKGSNWIDFESELKIIIDLYNDLEKEYVSQKINEYFIVDNHKAIKIFQELDINVFVRKDNDTYIVSEISLKALYKSLCLYLEKIIKALELYIAEFINKEKIHTFSPDVVDFNPDKVISFNYSNVFEHFYSTEKLNRNIDYIHGKANGFLTADKQSNIVLGISSDYHVNSYSVSFEKYYQRIVKKTGAKYKEWLKNTTDVVEIMFFGHSLDSTDKDILIDLIEYKKSFVKIIYHDEIAYKTIVENLNRVLGKEKLISYVYGDKPKIIFVSQKKACDKNSRGWEITNDIAKINNIHLLSNTDIKNLINKIKNKISKKDINYFYNQKSLISVYDALSKQQLDNLLSLDTASIIAKELDYDISDGLLVEYYIDFWTTINQFNEKDYSTTTKRLIDEINKINNVRFKNELKYSLTTLISSLKTKSKEIEIASILKKIIANKSLFENKKNINFLIQICQENNKIIDTLRKLENNNELDIGYIIKIRNVIKEYEQYQYYLEMCKSRKEEDWVAQTF